MDPWRSAQDVLRCHHCGGSTGFPLFCDICNTHLCKTCVGEHLSDFSKKHGLVSFGRRGSTYTCLKHSSNICDLFCEQCDHPICKFCISFKEHHGHFVEQEPLITLWFWELCIDLWVCGRFQELRHLHQCLEHYPLVKQEEVSFQGRSLQAFLRSFSQLISPVEINVLL